MQIKQLTTFQTICTTGSFTQAAAELNYTQSTVSNQIKALETSLGSKLFSYQHRRLTLTTAGRELLPKVQQLLTDYQSVLAVGPQKIGGTLTIAAPESLTVTLLPTILANYRQAYPEVQIKLQNATCEYNRQILRENNADVAFMMWPTLAEPDLVDHDLGQQAFSLVTGKHQSTSFDDYLTDSQATFIINEPQCSYRRFFEQTVQTHFQRTFNTMELWSIEAIKQSVIAGLGFSYLPTEMIQNELATGALQLMDTLLPCNIHAHLLTNRNWQSANARAFCQLFA